MGVTYMNDKPESESFLYAYVETADGALVRINIDNIRKTLGVNYVLLSTIDSDDNVVLSIGEKNENGDSTIMPIKKIRIGDAIYEVTDSQARSDIKKLNDSGLVTSKQLTEILKSYLSTDDNGEIVSFIENTETGIKVYMRDGSTIDVPISQAKEFETVEFDNENRYLHFYDALGNDVYDPVYIEGGGGSGSGSSSVVKLTNQNGTNTFTVASGAPVNLMFNFTSTEEDMPTGDGSCQITVNGAVKSSFGIVQGLTTVDVSSYLVSGSNTVRVTCTDIYGNYKSLIYRVSVVDMYITSTFDATVPYSGDITYKFTPYGSVEKTIHILVDGDEVNTTTTSVSGKQSTYIIPALSHGIHKLDVYATAELGGAPMESKHLTYDIICVEEGNISPMISSIYNVTTLSEGEQVTIPYIVYDPTKLTTDVTLDIYTISEGIEEIYTTQSITVDRSQQYWNTRRYPIGTVYFRITYGQIYKIHTVIVTESSIKVDPETNDLELSLSSEGRSNKESNPSVWVYGDYSTTFNNFNWNTNGWVNDDAGDTCLRLTGDARAVIQFKPFDNDIRTHGKTIELEFAIRDVNSRDVTVISCLSGGIGFEVKADTAYLKSEQSKIFCKYKDEEKVKLAFVVEARSEYRQLSMYLNGILSDVIQYPDNDNFQQTTPVNISIGSSTCGIDIYGIRSYSTALSPVSATNNYIADIKDVIERTETYERNDIYDEYGKLSFEKAKQHNSVMVLVGELSQSKGDKKKIKVKYYDVDDPSINYVDEDVTLDVQGTSSQYYARKNWKLKCSTNHYIDKSQLPAKVICIKVDYAEATGTHNTQNAIFVETLYSEKIPPQDVDPKCRTTIYGKPILLFHQVDESSEPTFYAKANYNYDKGAEHVFGFTSDYDVECWEFCNNTSDACNFLGEIPSEWGDDFEARYPDEYVNIGRFKVMHDWVVSTRRDTATGAALDSTFVGIDGTEYTTDTAEYRLAKFKMEFEDHFNMHYSLIYYVYTFFALMVDQRAKNMFMTYWASKGKWYPYFYDNDTCFGINNEGQLVFDYYHEDTDKLENANVYNGQNSVLWCNFRDAFPDKIKETYQNLRNNGYITYDKTIERFITNGSDKWSESIYNEDSDFKYITMLRTAGDASNLSQVRGSGEEHFRYFVENRLNYCDSKWYASDYANDYISLRIYTPSEWAGVEPDAAITVTPFSNMYAGVRYKANGTLLQKRVNSGEATIFGTDITETFNDTETAIYGAHQLSSIGDLAPLYCGSVNVSKADKLIELKVGDGTEGYSNNNLVELSVGTNKLLRKVDIQNCPNFASVLDVSNCPSIEEVYAKGSGITGVNFPEGSVLKKAQLPASIANFTLKHQIYVEELTFEGYDNIKTLWVENCPTVDGFDILNKAANVDHLRLTDMKLNYDTASEILELAARPIKGIDENGVNIDTMWIDGTCHIKTLTGAEYLKIKEAFPYMTITYDTLTAQLIFMSEDGNTELTRQTIQNGGNGTDPVTAGTIIKPSKSSTAKYDYTFTGWSLTANGTASATALNNVEADRKVYASFTGTIRSYTVRFYNSSTLLQTLTVQYGTSAIYTGDTPQNTSTGDPSDFEFYGWKPSPTNIQGDTSCYAQYHDLREITDSWETIAENCANGTATELYSVGVSKKLVIGEMDLPIQNNVGMSAVYNNEIHIIDENTHYKWNGSSWSSVSTLPCPFYEGSAVVYNDEIHILGGDINSTAHYKWNGSSWSSVSTLPYSFYTGSAVVYNNAIHILGGDGNSTAHYKWNGSSWSSVSTLPCPFYEGSAVVYNDEIHILGGDSNSTAHYKWNGSSWSSVSTLPYSFYTGSAVVYNNAIHILGGDGNSTAHYKWNGSSWSRYIVLPHYFYKGSAVVYNDEIHIFGGGYSTDMIKFYRLSADTDTWQPICKDIIPMTIADHNHDTLADGVKKWTTAGDLPFELYDGYAVVYNNTIHILGGYGNSTFHYKWDGSSWSSVSTLPYDFKDGSAVVYDNAIHILSGYDSANQTKHYKWDGSSWTEVSTLPYSAKGCVAVVKDNELHIMGSTSDSTAHYKWDGSSWTSVSTLKLSFAYSAAVMYNDEIHILGGSNGGSNHYKWDGSDWTYIGSLPFSYYYSSVIVMDGAIHMLGCQNSDSQKKHYKYDGTSWTEVETLPFAFYKGSAVLYDNTLFLLGGYNNKKNMIKNIGAICDYLSNLPYSFYGGSAVVYNSEIHILGGNGSLTKHYKYDGSSWTEVSTLPYNFNYGSAVVYNSEIHILGGSSGKTKHYKYDGSSWTSVSTLPNSFSLSSAVVLNGEIHILGGNNTGVKQNYHYKWNGSSWTEVSTLPYNFYGGSAVIYNSEIHILGGNGSLTKHYKYDGSSWSSVSTLPYDFYGGSAVVLNGKIYILGGSSNEKSCHSWNNSSWIEFIVHSRSVYFSSAVILNNEIHILGSFYNGRLHICISNPKSTLTFVAKTLLSDTYIMDQATSGSKWSTTELRQCLNSDNFLSLLPSELLKVLKTVAKTHNRAYPNHGEADVSNDKIWVLSSKELGLESDADTGTAYPIFTDDGSRCCSTSDDFPGSYWTRDVSGDTTYALVTENGEKDSNSEQILMYYVRIGFCI